MTVKELIKELKKHADKHGGESLVYVCPMPSDDHRDRFDVNEVFEVGAGGVAAGTDVDGEESSLNSFKDHNDGSEISETSYVLFPW